MRTALIVPAESDVAGQCRIVAKDDVVGNALRDYRRDPDGWIEIGLMNSRGELVCCDDAVARAELEQCVPLIAGLVIYYEVQS